MPMALATPHTQAKQREAYGNFEPALALLRGLHVAVVVFDAGDGDMVFFNPSFEAAFGAVAKGTGLSGLRLSQFEQLFRSTAARAPAASLSDGDHLHQPSGRWFHIRRSELACSKSGRRQQKRLVALELSDISQRLAEEQRRTGEHQQLLFTSKVMSVGEMAATLAHELNQPIGSLLNFFNGCMQRLDRDALHVSDLRAALLDARAQCERAAAIITRMREFVRTREPKMTEVDIATIFHRVTTLLESEIRQHHVEVTIDVATSVPAVLADRVMIEQVAHNLAKNAIEAMRTQSSPRTLLLHARLDDSGMVEASIQDSGPGIAQATRDQLFSPFFTTKADGLGIGLNICRSMMEFHGGALHFSQPAAGGSRFCFSLPQTSQTGDAP
jgi:C4-dicarboxylate-specific signal transduction histidine kinase